MIFVVAACFVLGLVLRRVPEAARRSALLDRWVIVVALPAVILHRMPAVVWGVQVAVPVLVAWSVIAISATAVAVASRWAGWSRATTGALLLVVPLGNTSFLGFPAVEVLLGSDHLGSAIAFDQGGSFMALATYGTIVAMLFGTAMPDGTATLVSAMTRRLVCFPPFIALASSMVFRLTSLPTPFDGLLAVLGATVGPVAMLSLGLRTTWTQGRAGGDGRDVLAMALGWRLIVVPAVVLAVALAIGDPSAPAWRVAVLESAMPPMVTAGILAAGPGLDGETATQVVGLGTILALLTVPIWAGALALAG